MTLQKASTYFLRAALCIMILLVLLICIFALPEIGKSMEFEFPSIKYIAYSVLIFYLAVIPFFFAIWQAFKLLSYIDAHTAFSKASVKALRGIKYSMVTIAVLFLSGMPFAFGIAQADDAPGVVAFAFILACSPLVVAVFTGLLEKLLQGAIDTSQNTM